VGISVHGEAGCIICCQPRILKALFPVANGVELKLYECASCVSSIWLITTVSKLSSNRGDRRLKFTTIDAALKAAALTRSVKHRQN